MRVRAPGRAGAQSRVPAPSPAPIPAPSSAPAASPAALPTASPAPGRSAAPSPACSSAANVPATGAQKKQEKLFLPASDEQYVAYWYRDNPIFYDRTLKEYKNSKKDEYAAIIAIDKELNNKKIFTKVVSQIK